MLGKKTCLPRKEGGLGIRSLEAVSIAFLKKIASIVMIEKSLACDYLKGKYVKDSRNIKSGPVMSSIWPAIHAQYQHLLNECI